MKLRPEKCYFAAEEVGYLGFCILRRGAKTDDSKAKAPSERAFPKTRKELMNFLDAVNFYRDLIPRFSFTATILCKMSQSNAKFKSTIT
jgi:hypothetical protein